MIVFPALKIAAISAFQAPLLLLHKELTDAAMLPTFSSMNAALCPSHGAFLEALQSYKDSLLVLKLIHLCWLIQTFKQFLSLLVGIIESRILQWGRIPV